MKNEGADFHDQSLNKNEHLFFTSLFINNNDNNNKKINNKKDNKLEKALTR